MGLEHVDFKDLIQGIIDFGPTRLNRTSTVSLKGPLVLSGSKTYPSDTLEPDSLHVITYEKGVNRLDFNVTANRKVQVIVQTDYEHLAWEKYGFSGSTSYFTGCSCQVATMYCAKVCNFTNYNENYTLSVIYRQADAISLSDYVTYTLSVDVGTYTPPTSTYDDDDDNDRSIISPTGIAVLVSVGVALIALTGLGLYYRKPNKYAAEYAAKYYAAKYAAGGDVNKQQQEPQVEKVIKDSAPVGKVIIDSAPVVQDSNSLSSACREIAVDVVKGQIKDQLGEWFKSSGLADTIKDQFL